MSEDDEDEIDEKDFYLSLIKEIIDDQNNMIGEKVAMQKARPSPLEIDKEDKINGFYGGLMTSLTKFQISMVRSRVKQ